MRSAFEDWTGMGNRMDGRLGTGPWRPRHSLEIEECPRQGRKQS